MEAKIFITNSYNGNGKLLLLCLSTLLILSFFITQVSALNLNETIILQQFSDKTQPILSDLMKTKYFRIIRLNLNQQCQYGLMNKLCKSKSCTVCRCDQKDIPEVWSKTDKVFHMHGVDVWQKQRSQQKNEEQNWVWHVEDKQNDKGQYFDVNQNIQSYTSYNGSNIWSLIYEQNCFSGKNFDVMCEEEKILYRLISGLHTSISSHLSNLYRNITTTVQWADDPVKATFHLNSSQYKKRVLDHPQRIENMLFLYQILSEAVIKIQPYLTNEHMIVSDSISQDLKATNLMARYLQFIKQTISVKFQDQSFFKQNPRVKQYQKYFHNISRILNCVQCQKCRLFGKMQTYGVGTALKILLGYESPYKRNEIVALFNTLNKITTSVNIYFENRPAKIEVKQQFESIESKQIKLLKITIIGLVIVILTILLFVNFSKKESKQEIEKVDGNNSGSKKKLSPNKKSKKVKTK